MATYRHWSVSLRRDPDDVPHCWILSSDKAEWRLVPAALCRWRCCFLADQLWFMTCIREEDSVSVCLLTLSYSSLCVLVNQPSLYFLWHKAFSAILCICLQPLFLFFFCYLLFMSSHLFSSVVDDWCLDTIRLFQITTTPTVFVRFSSNLARMIYVPICKGCGTDYFEILILKFFANF